VRRAGISGRIDPRIMERITASAALSVARAYGVGADVVGRACSGPDGRPGFVTEAIAAHCSQDNR
jgi:hypothetical protein